MEIWNSKSDSIIYFDFEVKFRVLSKVNFEQTVYRFEAQEVKSLML